MRERQKKMLNLINERVAISFDQLKKVFPNVSEMTIWNELKQIVRVHGGSSVTSRYLAIKKDIDRLMNEFV